MNFQQRYRRRLLGVRLLVAGSFLGGLFFLNLPLYYRIRPFSSGQILTAIAVYILFVVAATHRIRRWRHCLQCGEPFKDLGFSAVRVDYVNFPEYCNRCKAPILPNGIRHDWPKVEERQAHVGVWPKEIREDYARWSQYVKFAGVSALLFLGLGIVGEIILRYKFSRFVWAEITLSLGVLGLVGSFLVIGKFLKKIYRCPHCSSQVTSLERCHHCDAYLAPLMID